MYKEELHGNIRPDASVFIIWISCSCGMVALYTLKPGSDAPGHAFGVIVHLPVTL